MRWRLATGRKMGDWNDLILESEKGERTEMEKPKEETIFFNDANSLYLDIMGK
jgi:hypothetical protein